jgi:hypothetical protein
MNKVKNKNFTQLDEREGAKMHPKRCNQNIPQ